MSSQKEVALGLPQQSVGFFAESSSWNVYGTSNLKTVRQLLKSRPTEPADFWQYSCTATAYFFQLGYLRTKFQVPNFLF